MALYYSGHPNEQYFSGHCPIFAIELHKRTGFPLAAVLDHDRSNEVLVHAFLMLDSNGTILDASGISSIESVMEEFPNTGEAWVTSMDEDRLLQIGYGAVPPDVPPSLESDVSNVLEECESDLREFIRSEVRPSNGATNRASKPRRRPQ